MKDKYTDGLHNDAEGKLYQFGRELRKNATNAEKILWKYLRNRKLEGLKFRRQHALNKYIADFYCHEKKLVIELDGSVHDGKFDKEYDQVRTDLLAEAGITVIRFRNNQVEVNIDDVLAEIKKSLKINSGLTPPSP